MRFQIAHMTRYSYSHPVSLGPHVLRLRPRCDGLQRVRRFELRIEPRPVGVAETVDLEGNAVTEVWFLGSTDTLQISTTAEVETLGVSPFNYIVTHVPSLALPVGYPAELEPVLAAYRQPEHPHGPVARLANRVAQRSGGNSLSFLAGLAQQVRESVRYVTRAEGDPLPAEVTLADGHGSCRDLAILFMEAARCQGVAARFVSGYQPDESRDDQAMHAWVEVYLPGGGWRGYDPTLGLATSSAHVAISAGRIPSLAAPISGWFGGGEVQTRLQIDLRLESLPQEPPDVWVRPERTSLVSSTV